MNPTRNKLLIVLLLVVAMIATACRGSEDSADANVIVVEGASDASDSTTTIGDVADVADSDSDTTSTEAEAEASDAQGSEEEQALAFAACMRDEGIDFPDPEVGADGSVDFFGGGGGRDGDGGGFRDDPNFQSAIDVCGELIEGASFLPTDDDNAEREDTFLIAAECLREQGIDVPDPDFSAGGPGAGGPFGADFDPDDPATADAIEACQDVFTGLGQGGN
ncbi:MAG: hypothetical protein GXP35_01020 [Actinobacteria bacterium]|nr:hypothetical protein [Actinomycetota bacterium]